jgi:hypothetical protein
VVKPHWFFLVLSQSKELKLDKSQQEERKLSGQEAGNIGRVDCDFPLFSLGRKVYLLTISQLV